MSWLARFSTACVFSMCSAGYVIADLSPDSVWEGIEQSYEQHGFVLKADKKTDGDVLTLSNIRMQGSGDDAGSITGLSEISLKDRGDGTVGVICPDDMKLIVETPENELQQNMMFDVDCASLDIVVSGDEEQFDITYKGPTLAVKMPEGQSLVTDINEGSKATYEQLSMSLSGLDGETKIKLSDEQTQSQSLKVDMITYGIVLSDPDKGTSLEQNVVGRDLVFEGTLTSPNKTGDEASAAASFLNISGDYSLGEHETTFAATDGQSIFNGSLASSSAKGDIALDAEQISFNAISSDNQLNITQGAPFPIELKVAEINATVMAPVDSGDEPGPFRFGFALRDATIADVLWALFDPQEKLPRDPITLAVNLSGEATVALDDLEKGPASVDATQAKINTLRIEELLLRAVGAELKGEGSLAFDYSNVGATGKTPPPDGSLILNLTGANKLLDNLVATGLVPEEQVMGARMMIGLFARPGAGEDELTSKFDFTSDGQISANGQRIK